MALGSRQREHNSSRVVTSRPSTLLDELARGLHAERLPAAASQQPQLLAVVQRVPRSNGLMKEPSYRLKWAYRFMLIRPFVVAQAATLRVRLREEERERRRATSATPKVDHRIAAAAADDARAGAQSGGHAPSRHAPP